MNDLFEELSSDGEVCLAKLVEDRFQESVTVEFKEKSNSSNSNWEKDDKRNLGKILSAFSNSSGCVVIWGIRAAKNEDGIDCAQELKPINEIEKFSANANSLIGQVLAPMNDKIDIQIIKASGDQSSGYLAISVERSDRGPHRSEAPADKAYYKRVGDSSYPMEHYDIEDAFKRITAPELELRYDIIPESVGSSGGVRYQDVKLVLSLANISEVSALYPFLSIQNIVNANFDAYGLDGNMNSGIPRRAAIGKFLFGGGADHSVHPGQNLEVAALKLRLHENDIVNIKHPPLLVVGGEQFSLEEKSVSCKCQFGCKDARIRNYDLTIPAQEIVSAIEQASKP